MISIEIDGRKIEVESGTTVLQAAKSLGIEIPTLCHHEGLPNEGACRLCAVEIEERGKSKIVMACMYPLKEAAKISTRSERATEARKFVIQLLLNRNPKAPIIKKLAEEYDVHVEPRFASENDLCIRCGRCVRACEVNGTSAICFAWRGFEREIESPFNESAPECIGCLACAEVCPTGKIKSKDEENVRKIWHKEFELVACKRCGKKYATKQQLEFSGSKDGFCEHCRKAEYAKDFLLHKS